MTPIIEKLTAEAKALGVDGVDVGYNGPLTKENVQKIHGAELQLAVYTVDDIAEAQRLAEAGVDGITTNKPALMLEHFAK